LASLSQFLGWIFFVPTWILITYFVKVMDFFSQPFMSKSFTNVSWIWLLFSYLIIFSATYFLNKKYSKNFV
jgi:hypothetical protein